LAQEPLLKSPSPPDIERMFSRRGGLLAGRSHCSLKSENAASSRVRRTEKPLSRPAVCILPVDRPASATPLLWTSSDLRRRLVIVTVACQRAYRFRQRPMSMHQMKGALHCCTAEQARHPVELEKHGSVDQQNNASQKSEIGKSRTCGPTPQFVVPPSGGRTG
jgi:hypothetical protein